MDDGGDAEHFGYVSGSSIAGFLFTKNRERAYLTIWDVAEIPTEFPDQRSTTICSFLWGMFLCHYPQEVPDVPRYIIFNPYIPNSAKVIPEPPNDPHPDNIPRVLIAYHNEMEDRTFLHIVCALPTNDGLNEYNLEVYSSADNEWTSAGPHPLGRIREETGVGICNTAYWLVQDSPFFVWYNVETKEAGTYNLPEEYVVKLGRRDTGLHSQLGEVEGTLCFVAATDQWRAVYSLSHDPGEWTCHKEVVTDNRRGLPILSRFQGEKLQVPFWFDDGKLDIWDSSWAWDDRLSCERALTLQGPQREAGTNILPVIHTLIDPSQL